jgi:hypothetical protein
MRLFVRFKRAKYLFTTMHNPNQGRQSAQRNPLSFNMILHDFQHHFSYRKFSATWIEEHVLRITLPIVITLA